MPRTPFLKRHRAISLVTCLFLFTAFLLFLLVALSMPIIKPIYLASFHATVQPGQPATSIATQLRVGVWGVCATSALNTPTAFTNNGDCTHTQLGYTIPDNYLQILGVSPSLADAVLKGLLIVLILHPIAAGVALVGFVFSLCLASHALSIVALINAIVSACLSSIVLAVDVALVVVAKSKVKDITLGSFQVDFGNAVWMVLVGCALTWLAVILLSARVCFCCGFGRRIKERELEMNGTF